MQQVPNHNRFISFVLPFFLAIIVDVLSFGIITPILATMVITTTQSTLFHTMPSLERHIIYGAIIALAPFCYIFSAPFMGYLSDHWGRKRVLLGCNGGSLLGLSCYLASFIYGSLSLLILGRIIIGCSSGSLACAQSAMADISVGTKRTNNIALIAVAMTIGLIAGPFLGGILSDHSLCRWFRPTFPFYVAILLTLFNFILLSYYLSETSTSITNSKQNKLNKSIFLFKKIQKSAKIRWLLIIFFIFELSWSLYFQSLALSLSHLFHLTSGTVGLFLAYIGLSLSLGLMLLLRVLLYLNYSLTSITIAALAFGTVAYTYAFAFNQQLLQWLIGLPISLTVALAYAAMISQISSESESQQGLLMGLTDSLLSTAFAITGLLSGFLVYLNPHLPAFLSGIGNLIAGILFIRYIVSPNIQYRQATLINQQQNKQLLRKSS